MRRPPRVRRRTGSRRDPCRQTWHRRRRRSRACRPSPAPAGRGRARRRAQEGRPRVRAAAGAAEDGVRRRSSHRRVPARLDRRRAGLAADRAVGSQAAAHGRAAGAWDGPGRKSRQPAESRSTCRDLASSAAVLRRPARCSSGRRSSRSGTWTRRRLWAEPIRNVSTSQTQLRRLHLADLGHVRLVVQAVAEQVAERAEGALEGIGDCPRQFVRQVA